ncbi:IclR family transcriptional regulator [Lysinibacillus macroides]|uniref:IclR family transcriptional regulator n=1 Tax=Lysinibacillus macroides TaxID=33935 RepID=A0A0N0CVW4_9BACI|nr:IclR family transcriptional regulator [Lysinibacillus macroides]KOY82305.1 IclR family transcriptional regulator [Lysinibacillus macroides]QPR68110.1 IclR family transcriptional regulator [Lysinibacillus macroides]
MKKSTSTIGSLVHAINIIDIVTKSEFPLKFSEIQELSGISKSNLYKYINTLLHMDLLYRDKQGHIMLGYKFLEYGNAAMKNNDIVTKLTSYFKEISNLTNMSTSLTVWLNDTPVITNIWNTNYGLNIGAQIGTKLPLLSAGGKMFAAYASNDEIRQWILNEQKKYPDLDIEAFQQELEQIRQKQIAFANEPLVNHVSSWSFPILNYKNELIAAVAIIGFTDEVPKDSSSSLVQQVLQLGQEMSSIYGYKA